MTIFRGNPPLSCDELATSAIRDTRLSYKARGLILTILETLAAEGFGALSVVGLARLSSDGSNAVRTGLQELAAVGYLGRGRAPGNPSKIHYHLVVPPPVGVNGANGDITRTVPAAQDRG